MAKPGIRELLIDCVLDPRLLQRARQSPESLFEDYELDAATRALLASPDERLLELLGQAFRNDSPGEQAHAVESATIDGPARAAPVCQAQDAVTVNSLAASRLAVRLVPILQRSGSAEDGDQTLAINYAGHLDNLPAGTELDDLPEVPVADVPGQALPALAVSVSIQPQVWTDRSGNQQITFSLSASLPPQTNRSPERETNHVAAPGGQSPWQHDTTSSEVLEAARRVHDASTGDRRARLLELIDVMTTSRAEAGQ